MIKLMYSIFDKATKIYLAPYPADTEQEAIRQFSMSVNHEGGFINRFPGDYSLQLVGSFDISKGQLFEQTPPEFTVEGLKLLRPDHAPTDQLPLPNLEAVK